jgi:two-component system chemotaxis sensor kinase CheA
VELVIRGDEIEIDRRILEQIKDPLNHLFRNCVDHGVEQPAAREHKGKPAHPMPQRYAAPGSGLL